MRTGPTQFFSEERLNLLQTSIKLIHVDRLINRLIYEWTVEEYGIAHIISVPLAEEKVSLYAMILRSAYGDISSIKQYPIRIKFLTIYCDYYIFVRGYRQHA